jgi:hypothetical protein
MDRMKAERARKLAKKHVAAKAAKTRSKARTVRQRAAQSKDFQNGGFGAPGAVTSGDAQTSAGLPMPGMPPA